MIPYIFTVKANSGEFSLTKEEMQQVAEGLLPTGLKEKLTSGEIEELVNYSKSYERPQEETALYNPGPILIANALKDRYYFRTIPEIGTDKENIYCYNGQINVRAEELIKKETHDEYLRQWEHILQLAKERKDRKYIEKMQGLLHRGPSTNDINEVLQTIRRTTFTSEEMNPNSHIPFKNGLLNLKTRELEEFTPDLFYTYQINANLLKKYVTLRDTPQFTALLNKAFYETDIPMVLSYFGYAFHPDLPVHRVLFILGRERIGKGTCVRVIQGLIPKGSGSISLGRLLTSDRFQFRHHNIIT